MKKNIGGGEVEVYDITDTDGFNKAYLELEKENKTLIEEQKAKEKEYIEVFLEEEVNLELTKFDFDDIPEDIGHM